MKEKDYGKEAVSSVKELAFKIEDEKIQRRLKQLQIKHKYLWEIYTLRTALSEKERIYLAIRKEIQDIKYKLAFIREAKKKYIYTVERRLNHNEKSKSRVKGNNTVIDELTKIDD